MGVYIKGNPKEGEYKLIKTIDGFVLEGEDIVYACIEIVRCGECAWYEKPYCRWHNIDNKPTDFCSYGERRADEKTL